MVLGGGDSALFLVGGIVRKILIDLLTWYCKVNGVLLKLLFIPYRTENKVHDFKKNDVWKEVAKKR